jgi:GNAT superfamily N-acetyltransferase
MAERGRPMSAIVIVPFRREYAADFRRLNLDWIERLFQVEAPDLKVLDDPERAIVADGGMVFFALEGEAVVGTVAMICAGEGRCELAKMAVARTHQGRGIGEQLGRACKLWAVENGFRTVFLETNSRLANAIRLYERLGFRYAVDPHPSDYARADVYMELPIEARGG